MRGANAGKAMKKSRDVRKKSRGVRIIKEEEIREEDSFKHFLPTKI